MKATIEISENLYRRANQYAADQGITLSELVETALRMVVERERATTSFRLRNASFAGDGLQPGVTWNHLREESYGDPRATNPRLDF